MRDQVIHLLGFVFPSVVLACIFGALGYWTTLLSSTARQAVVVGVVSGTGLLILLHWQIDRSGDYHGPSVRLQCPQTGKVFATENTMPVANYGAIATYWCNECSGYHSFRWGPPTPILIHDQERDDTDEIGEVSQ